MSSLKSIKDGSLGAANESSYQDGSLGGHLFAGMEPVSGTSFSNMTAVSGHMNSFKDGSLGCACSTKGLGEYFGSGLGFLEMLDTTPKKIGAGVAAVLGLYLIGKQTKLIKNSRGRRTRRRRR